MATIAGFVFGITAMAQPDRLPGPIPAEVIRVIDGDTLAVRARIWLDQVVEVHVRLYGIDAPELHGGCPEERRLAEAAKARLAALTGGGSVTLWDVRHGKFARRVVARARTAGNGDLSEALIARGLARRYEGGARPSWCVK